MDAVACQESTSGGRACQKPSGQIPPPWAWWENEAPAARAARSSSQAQAALNRSAQLGHASATVTLDRYGHLFPDELQQLADRLQDAYAEASTDPARTEAAEAMLRQRKEAGQ